jgi:glutamate-ammonia-ligase adenylyltransferase
VLTSEVLARTLAEAPDPELARVALSRVGEDPTAREALEREEALAVLVHLLGFSSAAADFLVARPEETGAVADVRPRDPRELKEELGADVARLGPRDGLRRFRRRAMLRVAARDLAGAAVDDVVAEITAIAEVCLVEAARDAPFAVIGLGKLGGAELNYSSDVDVVFVHRGGGGRTQEEAERAAASMIRLLSEPTEDGIVLRVDPTLRPGGRGGALSRSLPAMLDHYARGSATWERQALIKARPIAGPPDVGQAFVEGVEPFVYPEHLEPETIDDVRRTKVRLEEYVRQRGKELTEVKRGRGGIRDVEFAVQLLQIVHGRRDPRLREPNTLRALQALADHAYVAATDAGELAEAYRMLRRIEHRLQIVRDLQTHDLPGDPRARTTLARSLGMADVDELRRAYDRTTETVRGIHERLFYRPLLEAFAGPARPAPGADRAATEELLAGLGFREPGRSYEVLDRVIDPGRRVGAVIAHVFPVMAPALALAADPDAGLVRLQRVVEAVGERAELADALTEPVAARRLAHAVAASSFATDLIVADPERLSALGDPPRSLDDQAALLRVVGRYAGRELDPRETGREITWVADRVVTEAVVRSRPRIPLAVIGMGKLGARELQFASDLDIVFVYEGGGPEDQSVAQEAAERIMAEIRAAGWEPDADLRPEGRSGPLARSMAGFLEYWERYADPWEFQSLLRARAVAGDPGLGRRFELNAADLAYPPDGVTVDRAAEMRRMRERIERERVRPAEAARFHFKLGIGSLADVQFAVELSLLRHGGRLPVVRTTGTLEAIERLAEVGALAQSEARDLGEAFVFLCDVKNALEIDRRQHAESIPPGPHEQTILARQLGYEQHARRRFLDDYLRITRRCRRAMERVFREEPD